MSAMKLDKGLVPVDCSNIHIDAARTCIYLYTCYNRPFLTQSKYITQTEISCRQLLAS
jgi:hypothetical protein